MRTATTLLISTLIIGCGGSVDREVEDRLTITQGVYGQTVYYDDVSPVSFDYMSSTLQVFGVPRENAEAVAETESDERGFYEFELATGDYEICISGDRCHPFTIAEGTRLRLDYQTFEPGWWEGQIQD